ncbi:MAG: glycerophosphodiester phosphodiesterase [Bacillaceae bacterium]|nr:glycerophosphodiester phosphodiesterase [Bacillaceae bacterium]
MSGKAFKIFAHRGLARKYPENTILAFKKALAAGANGLELDVQLSRDGQAVVIHDLTLDRTTSGSGAVRHLTLRQLKRFSAGSWFHPRFRHCRIPSLEDVLQQLAPHPVYFNIELKNLIVPMHGIEKEVIRLLRQYQVKNRAILSSYNLDSLEKIKIIDPTIQTALLYFGKLETPWKTAADLHASYVHPPANVVNHHFVTTCHRYGLRVHPYPVNDTRTFATLYKNGIDGVITESPERITRYLRYGKKKNHPGG